jgi:hypothetical protein
MNYQTLMDGVLYVGIEGGQGLLFEMNRHFVVIEEDKVEL